MNGNSTKHLQISKAASTITIVIALASFVTVVSLVAAKSLYERRNYQSKVITKKEAAVATLKSNLESMESLSKSYGQFVDQPANVIGGATVGTGDRDGDNAKIVLDALPSKYDFPALATSVDKLLTISNVSITSIDGQDAELSQANATGVVDIPFKFSVKGNLDSITNMFTILERSIRPIKITKMDLRASDTDVNVLVEAITNYQPEYRFEPVKEVVPR